MNVNVKCKLGLVTTILCATIGIAMPVAAQDKLSITLDTPPGHVRNIWIGKFADALTERSDGALAVEIFDSGQLYSSRDAGKAVARGDAGMAIVATPALARIETNLNVLDLPMFNGMTPETKNGIVDGDLGQLLSKMTAEKMGVVVPGGWYILGGLNTYSTKTAIKSFADLEGLQVRIPGAASWIAAYKALGATPVSMPFSDVPLALQQGTVDAIVTSNVSILSGKLHESGLKFGFSNKIGIGYYMPIVSQTYWDSLSEDQQILFKTTWNDFVPAQRAAAISQQGEAQKRLEAAGMVFFEPSPEDLAQANAQIQALQDSLVDDLNLSENVVSMATKAVE